MRIGSLFSGYGGADLAVQSVFPDATPAWFVEYDKHPSTILAKRFPGVKNYGDVTTVDWAAVEPVDILTAGWLKALGNGIVWQQMALALRMLLADEVAV